MSKRNWVFVITSVGLLFIFLVVYNYYKNKDIEENLSRTCGIIDDYWYTTKGTTKILIFIYHNGVKYKNVVGNWYFKDCEKTGWCIGKCFEVEFSSKNPNNSRMNFNKPCDCDSLIIQQGVVITADKE